MKMYFNIILYIGILLINLINIVECADAIVLTPGPVTCNYKKKDLNESYDINTDTLISCNGTHCDIRGSGASNKDDVLLINKSGTYIMQGKYEGQFFINASEEDYIHLVLDDVYIKSTQGPALYVVMADKVTITLVGNSKMTDSSSYTLFDDGEPDACLFVDADLSINGEGSLAILTNYSDGIRCKKDLKIVNGNIVIPSAKKFGIKARNSICFYDGIVDVTSADTAIKVTKDNNPEKGFIVVDGGRINVNAGNKGIHSETHLTIYNGYIDITKSKEGLESQMIDILGGDIHIVSSNDGINGSKITDKNQKNSWFPSSGTDGSVYINIVGGKTYITVPGGDVDAIDANGNLYIGGKAEVYANMGSGQIYGNMAIFDADGLNAICKNATVVGTAGRGGFWKRNDFEKRQWGEYHYIYEDYLQVTIPIQAGGTKLSILDSFNNTLISYVPTNSYSAILVASPKFVYGEFYYIAAGTYVNKFYANRANTGGVANPPSVTAPPVKSDAAHKTKTTTTTTTTTTNVMTTTTSTTTTITTNIITTTTRTRTTTTTTTTTTNKSATITSTSSLKRTTTTKTVPLLTSLVVTTKKVTKTSTTTKLLVTSTLNSVTSSSPTPTVSHDLKCSLFILEQGYKCCSDNCKVAYSDTSGDWGYEKGEWCGCGTALPPRNHCSQKILNQGYACCSDQCSLVYIDESGHWGYENNRWCGCTVDLTTTDCSLSIIDQGYKCCSKNNCKVKHIDDDGKWGIEDNEWCGIYSKC